MHLWWEVAYPERRMAVVAVPCLRYRRPMFVDVEWGVAAVRTRRIPHLNLYICLHE